MLAYLASFYLEMLENKLSRVGDSYSREFKVFNGKFDIKDKGSTFFLIYTLQD